MQGKPLMCSIPRVSRSVDENLWRKIGSRVPFALFPRIPWGSFSSSRFYVQRVISIAEMNDMQSTWYLFRTQLVCFVVVNGASTLPISLQTARTFPGMLPVPQEAVRLAKGNPSQASQKTGVTFCNRSPLTKCDFDDPRFCRPKNSWESIGMRQTTRNNLS